MAAYTLHDIHFTVVGYVWLGIWYSFAVFEMVYVKRVVDTVEMTTWSRTYYQVRSEGRIQIQGLRATMWFKKSVSRQPCFLSGCLCNSSQQGIRVRSGG